jgi:hypothetical protein
MFVKVFFHNNPPTFFEVINCFSMIDGHVHHIMEVLEDSTPNSLGDSTSSLNVKTT